MDPSFFGLSGHPFTKPAAPDSHCLADEHLALTTELHAGLKAPHGITLLIGDEGAGKTTFIRNFVAQLPDAFVVAYLPTAGPGLRHLLTEAVEQLGGTVVPGGGEQALIDVLRSLARARAEHDRATLVVIDDAHELPAKTIERLGKLFGTDPAEPSRLHVTLVGRPELLDRMNAANDRSILKHLVQVCRMDAIGPEDAFRYIADRIQKVGGIVDRLFTEDALRLVVQRANGNPARIDAICSAALERAAGRGAHSVDTDAVDTACGDAPVLGHPEVGNVTNDQPETPTYFFSEDAEDGAAAPTTAAKAQVQASPPLAAAMPSVIVAGATSRRRLAFWAAGAIAVVAAFAGMMTLPDRTSIQAEKVPAEGDVVVARADRRSEKNGGAAIDNTEAQQPAAVPKLVMRKDGENPGHPRPGGRRAAEEKRAAESAAIPPSAAPPVAGASGDAKQMPAAVASESGATPGAADRPRFPAPQLGTAATGTGVTASAPAGAAVDAAKPAAQAPGTAVPTPVPPPPAAQQLAQAPAPSSPTPTPPVAAQPPVAAPAAVAAPKVSTTPAAPTATTTSPARAKPTDAGLVAPTRAPVEPSAAPPVAPAKPAPGATASSAAAPVVSATTSAGGAYTIQIGAFSSRANAEALIAKVRGTVPDGKIIASTAAGKPVFRVVVGSFGSSAEAATRSRELAKAGLSTFVRRVD